MHLQKLKISCTELGGIVGKSPEFIPTPKIETSVAFFDFVFLLILFQLVSVESLLPSVVNLSFFFLPVSPESPSVLWNFTEQDLKLQLLLVLSLLSNDLFNLEQLCFVLTAFKNISAIFVFENRGILFAQHFIVHRYTDQYFSDPQYSFMLCLFGVFLFLFFCMQL